MTIMLIIITIVIVNIVFVIIIIINLLLIKIRNKIEPLPHLGVLCAVECCELPQDGSQIVCQVHVPTTQLLLITENKKLPLCL